jgi:indole-3-glycerol phosphate synthase
MDMKQHFVDALDTADRPLIMEIKLRSGSGIDLLQGRTVREVVADYEAACAPCISVVTGQWFGGSDALLQEVAKLTNRPLLKKDFVTTDSQIKAAQEAGASAILLTARLLPRALLRQLIRATLRRHLTPFIEVDSAADLEGLNTEDCIVAANNKDILQRECGDAQFARGLDLIPAIRRSGASHVVSASGIETPDIAAGLIQAGFDALLIGTGLLACGNIPAWVNTFDQHRMATRGLIGLGMRPVPAGNAWAFPLPQQHANGGAI